MGQYYCLHCDRYFANVAVRDEHSKTKRHKKWDYPSNKLSNHREHRCNFQKLGTV
uniref:Putative zinc finger, U1-type, Zinc finger, C2H2, Zinc finger, double-stranded RNA binding protein n=2 Tax=Helianthus annuus TaxID=4232 RepID=A0A251S2D3_HELAN